MAASACLDARPSKVVYNVKAQICIMALQAIADRDYAYEKIMSEPIAQLQMLAEALRVEDKVHHIPDLHHYLNLYTHINASMTIKLCRSSMAMHTGDICIFP